MSMTVSIIMFVAVSVVSLVGGYCSSRRPTTWSLYAFVALSIAVSAVFMAGASIVNAAVFAGLALLVSGLVAFFSEDKHNVFAVPVYVLATLVAVWDVGFIVVALTKLG